MNVTALATRERQGGGLAIWDREQLDVIKTLICPGASDAELALFGQVCQRTGLDPFSRQIYGLMRSQRQQVNGEWRTVEKLSIQTSIDGFRLIAERSGKYGGQVGPQWCGTDGQWRDVWLASEYPAAARVGVIRTDWREPLYAVARWDSYVQTHKDRKSGQDVVGNMWQRMPDVMLAKVAESLALRRAFPAELSGLYTSEEMQQADHQQPAASISVVSSEPQPEPEPEPEPTGLIEGWNDALLTRWNGGLAKASQLGMPEPKAIPDDATRAQVIDGLKALGVAIRERERACVAFEELTKAAVALGIDVEVIDPKTLTADALNETHAALKEMYDTTAAATATDDDDAF